MTSPCRRSGGLAVLATAAAIGLAACGGPGSRSAASAPTVASLGTSNGAGSGSSTTTAGGSSTSSRDGSTATALSTGDATQLLNEWAACMRSHGDPDQADPTVDANKVIHIVMSPSVPGGIFGQDRNTDSGPGTHCQAYLTAAITALRGGHQYEPPDPADLVKYAECMRANGVPDFPDPAAGGLQLHSSPGSGLDPNSPAFQNAAKVCTKKTGVYLPGGGGPLPPGAISSGPAGQPGGVLIWFPGGSGGSSPPTAPRTAGTGAGG